MKKLLFGLMALIFAVNLTSAQEDPEKALNKASKALASYNLDPTNNAGKLKEAIDMIEIAAAADVNKGKVKTWQTKGEIYNAVADKDLIAMTKNPDAKPENPNAPMVAAESFFKALEVAQKKYETKDAVTGLQEASGKLNAFGNSQIKSQDYMGAFNSLNMVLRIDEACRKNGGDPVIADQDMANHKYVVAFCAGAAKQAEPAKKLLKELYDGGSNEPAVYAQYFDLLYKDGQKEEAWKVFDSGQKKFPTSTEILFAGINAKISEGDKDALKNMLGKAIEAEPNNPSVYTALGNVYMGMFNDEYAKDKKSATAQSYFDESLKYFSQAIKLDAKQFDAIYSVGSLYFNKAVELIKMANGLPMTKDGQAQYKVYMDESKALMETALPYFKKTESMQPNDMNTLIALSEIFARTNDFEKSKEFKARLELVKQGKEVGSSYFKE